jgi:Protein of unknown function (DUF1822)
MNQLHESSTFPVPLSFSAHALAEKMRQQLSSPQKAKQVYLNTLAVYAVDFYLHCLGIETELDQSDSQNPFCLKFMDVADLQVKSIGKLECRPILPGASDLEIPAEVRADRVGYLAVQFDQSLKQATIIGFTPTAAATVPLRQLRPIAAFPEYLQQLRPSSINLRQWIDNCFEEGWQELSAIFSPNQLALAFRNPNNSAQLLERGKSIQLVTPQTTINIILVVELNSLSTNDLNIRFTILSEGDHSYLPADLQVRILDAHRTTVMQAIAGQKNQNMEFDFNVNFGEQFSVHVDLDKTFFRENFVV